MTEESRFDSPQRQHIVLFSTEPRIALDPTLPKWAPQAPSSRLRIRGAIAPFIRMFLTFGVLLSIGIMLPFTNMQYAEPLFQRNNLATFFGICWRHPFPIKVRIDVNARADTQNNDDVSYRTGTLRCSWKEMSL